MYATHTRSTMAFIQGYSQIPISCNLVVQEIADLCLLLKVHIDKYLSYSSEVPESGLLIMRLRLFFHDQDPHIYDSVPSEYLWLRELPLKQVVIDFTKPAQQNAKLIKERLLSLRKTYFIHFEPEIQQLIVTMDNYMTDFLLLTPFYFEEVLPQRL